MKVLKVGTLPEPQAKPWPIDVQIICPYCKCKFAPETKDDYTIKAERCPGGRYEARMSCPTCDRPVLLDRP